MHVFHLTLYFPFQSAYEWDISIFPPSLSNSRSRSRFPWRGYRLLEIPLFLRRLFRVSLSIYRIDFLFSLSCARFPDLKETFFFEANFGNSLQINVLGGGSSSPSCIIGKFEVSAKYLMLSKFSRFRIFMIVSKKKYPERLRYSNYDGILFG